jgi:hypothetical protein
MLRLFLSIAFFFASLPAQAESSTYAPGFQDCHETSGPVNADDSPNRAYFEDLAARGMNAPLKDFLRLWYPGKPGMIETSQVGDECRKVENAYVIKSSVAASPAPATSYPKPATPCFYDTVYSWGPKEKLFALLKTMPDNDNWRGPPNPGRNLDTVASAIGSFGYGMFPVRVKLKPGRLAPPSEYIVNDGSEVESWSFGTPEHYDEIVRDYLRYESKQPWIGYWGTASFQGDQHDRLFFPERLDGHEFSEQNLKAALLAMVQMILKGEGRIFYSSDTCRNRKLAFETRFPNYVNPFPDPQAAAALKALRGAEPPVQNPAEPAGASAR